MRDALALAARRAALIRAIIIAAIGPLGDCGDCFRLAICCAALLGIVRCNPFRACLESMGWLMCVCYVCFSSPQSLCVCVCS